MNVTEAIKSRRSIRAFLSKPVPESVVLEILHLARCAPSGGNLQPWHVYVMAGEVRDGLVESVTAQLAEKPMGEGAEYEIYPPRLVEPYRSRRYQCGEDLYATLGIAREDRAGRLRHLQRNFRFFDAPIGMIFTIHRRMEPGQWADVGMFLENIMLLARERGLDTCPQEAWAMWHQTIREYLALSPEEMVFCGMALGYADPDAPVNMLRTDRAGVEEFASFHGFDASAVGSLQTDEV